MPDSRFAAAQAGVLLAEAMPCRSAAEAKKSRQERRARGGAKKGPSARARSKGAGDVAPTLPAPAALSTAERLRLLDAFETVLGGVYTHLPLKRARYGFDPVQRLRILRSQIDELTDDGFHIELADIVTRMRDAHTRYTGPTTLSDKVAALPFLVDMIGSAEAPTYVVTRVGAGFDPAFKPG